MIKDRRKRKEIPYLRYCRWWLGKKVRLAMSDKPFKKVVDIELVEPPSFFYGEWLYVKLYYEDGTSEWVKHPDRTFTPRKKDVEVLEENDR